MNRQPARLARWFHLHAVLPTRTAHGIDISCEIARSQLDANLKTLADASPGKLKVWIGHFDDGADVVWDRKTSPLGDWRTQSVQPHANRANSMVQTLIAAETAGAQVVVFPEFTLDTQHQQLLSDYLRKATHNLQLVVAGAFHAAETANHGSVVYNLAPVFIHSGRRLFVHRKLRLFGKDDVGAEFAQVGNKLHVVITPIGCMTVLICKDFMDEDPRVDNLLAEVLVDWAWVPSYGNETTLKSHKERARRLATVTTGTSSAVAQTQNTAMKKVGIVQAMLPGFGHVAGTKAPVDVGPSGGVVEFELTTQPTPLQRSRPALKRVK